MGKRTRNKMPGLYQRNGIWHIDKQVYCERIQESTETSDYEEAVNFLTYRLEQLRQAKVYGVRPKRTFAEAAAKYLREKQKRSIADDVYHLDTLMPYIGELPLESIHMDTLKPYIKERQDGTFAEKVKNGLIQVPFSRCKKVVSNQTINHALRVVRHILNLAAEEWRDENGLTWLAVAPKIKLMDELEEKRTAIPLSWEEQDQLFSELSPQLRRMVTFAVNTGCRNDEVCDLRWEWEIPIPVLNTTVFVIPRMDHKNKHERLVVLNDIAKALIEEVRGIHPTYVFTYKGKPYYDMNSSSWRKGRKRAGLPHVRVHDLKHTFATRLRNAGVSREDRKDLLGHLAQEDITTHYSVASIRKLIELANLVCTRGEDISVARFLKQLNANAKRNTGNVISFAKEVTTVKKAQLSTTASNEILINPRKTPTGGLQDRAKNVVNN